MENAFVVIALALLILAICREITCWYFKFNAMLEVMTETRDTLATIQELLEQKSSKVP